MIILNVENHIKKAQQILNHFSLVVSDMVVSTTIKSSKQINVINPSICTI